MKACDKLLTKVRELDYGTKAVQEYCGKSYEQCRELTRKLKYLDDDIRLAKTSIKPSSISSIISLEKTHPELVDEVIEKVVALENPTGAAITAIVEKARTVDHNTPLQLRLFNTWNFSEALHGDAGYEWGYNTGHITENLLYYYTKENDLVIDPMVGSGTTIGACERMNRRCLTYDKEEDIRKGIKTTELAQLVFLDPPFFTLLKNEFEDYDDFLTFVLVCIEKSIKVLKEGGYLALIMMNLCEVQNNPKYPMIGDVYKILASKETLVFENMILAPLSTQRSGTDKAKENKELLNNARVVWVFRKL